jgi:hypothetical protein
MCTPECGCRSGKADKQGAKLIDPGKTAFVREELPVDIGIEQGLASAFRRFTLALGLCDIRDDTVTETDFPRERYS